jgi:hypothetical protein
MSASASGIPNVPAPSRSEPRPVATALALAQSRQGGGALSGTLLMRCIGAAIALPGLIALAACLYDLLCDHEAVGAVIGIVVGAEFAAVGLGIFHFAYLAGPVSPARQADFLARHMHDL